MSRRPMFVAIAVVIGLTVVPTAAMASTRHGMAGNTQCAKVTARMPHQAHLGDAVGIESSLENCGTQTETIRFVYRLDGPCIADHSSTPYTMSPGEGFGEAGEYVLQCDGRYRLLVEAFIGGQLFDRKVRHMTVTG